MAAGRFWILVVPMAAWPQRLTALPVLTETDATYWLPLKPDGSDGRQASLKEQTTALVSSASWECIFDPQFRESSKAFEVHWKLAQAPNISDTSSPYYDALDQTYFSAYTGDENQLSSNSSDPEAPTKWLTYGRCFNVNKSTCGKCQKAIEAALLIRRAFIFSTRPSDAPYHNAVVMGTGPAGLLAAIELSMLGHSVVAAEERYSPDGYTRARSLGNFRSSERMWSAIGMPRQFTQNAYYYKQKRGAWLFMIQEYMKMIAIKVRVVFASDCSVDFDGATLVLQSRQGKAPCSLLNVSTAQTPHGTRSDSTLRVDSAEAFIVNAVGANKEVTSRWATGTKIIAGAPQEMTEVLAELLRQNSSYESYWAPESYDDMQGASVVKLPNQWGLTVNGAFETGLKDGDLEAAWERFNEDAISTVDWVRSLGADLAYVSDMDFPKNSYFYLSRKDVALFFAFVINFPNHVLRTNGSFDYYSNNSYKFPLPPSSSYGGTAFQVNALPNTALFPIPNNTYCKHDILAQDDPAACKADVDENIWATAPHMEGSLQPAPVGGDITQMAKLAWDFNDMFDPGAAKVPANSSFEKVQCSAHKLKEIALELLRIAYPKVPELKIQNAVENYFKTQNTSSAVASMTSGVIRLGFTSLPWQSTGPANQRVIATNENRTSFPVGDAAEPAWYRFGLGLDESWRTSRVAVLCSVAKPELCNRAILHQQYNWRQRVIHLFFDGWYTQFWKLLPSNATKGVALNQAIKDLIKKSKVPVLAEPASGHEEIDDEGWYVPWSQRARRSQTMPASLPVSGGKSDVAIVV